MNLPISQKQLDELREAGYAIMPAMPTKDMLDAYMRALEAPLPDGDKRYPYYRTKAIKRYCAMADVGAIKTI